MLSELTVRNLAVVEDARLELGPGLTALTGETGAGKSLLIDALGLVLGERARPDLVRPGVERASVTAVFELRDAPAARALLAELEVPCEEELCILRRVISREGRSRAYLNDTPVNTAVLRTLAPRLVDIHGQHSWHRLTRPGAQRALLDGFGAGDPGYRELLEQVGALAGRWRALREERESLPGGGEDLESRRELLAFQLADLEGLGLEPGELARLESEHRRLSRGEELTTIAAELVARLDDEDSGAWTQLERCRTRVRELEPLGREPTDALEELLAAASANAEEALAAARALAARIEIDPERLGALEARLARIHDYARKYRVRPEELPARTARIREELESLEEARSRLGAIDAELDALRERYRMAADALTGARRAAGERLAEAVAPLLRELGLPESRFEVRVESTEPGEPSGHGQDRVELLVATNPGHAPAPLGRVASGGELSRIGLAIEVATLGQLGVPTLVFDEVDAGVGGRIAELVGRHLRALAQAHQVLCVTHLPQVASQAGRQMAIRKELREGTSTVRVLPLDEGERVDEIARMLGGVRITPRTRAHAREMLEAARTPLGDEGAPPPPEAPSPGAPGGGARPRARLRPRRRGADEETTVDAGADKR